MWDLSCPDWEGRIREQQSLIPDLPLNETEAAMGLAFYDQLPLPDGLDEMTLGEASGNWFRDIVRVVFGSWEAETRVRSIRDFFVMAPKGSSKTTYSAGLMLTAMLMNRRRNVDALFIGPTQAISDRAYDQAAAMVRKSPALSRRFKCIDHQKTLRDLDMNAELKVKTFALDVLTGAIVFFVLLDELHVLGSNPNTTKVLRQIRGGLDKTQEGVLLITTTQSDEIPAGAFKDELLIARKIRNGAYRGKIMRPMLPVLYEFPADIAKNQKQWGNPENWPMVMPNLGRSVHLHDLIPDWNSEREKGDKPTRIWASQHLNIEIGVGIEDDGWAGASFWKAQADPALTLDALIERSEVITFGGDGGGLDDLLGVAVMGREKETRRWLLWNHALAHEKVLEVRKDIASRLRDFEREGSLTICKTPSDLMEKFGDLFAKVAASGKLPEKNAVGLDPNNVAAMIEALNARGMTDDMLRRLLQGPALSPAWWGMEMKLADGTLLHSGLALMDWVVGNAKVEPRGNGILITKQQAGRAKIDPLIAAGCAAILMSWNPVAKSSPKYQMIIV